MPFSPDRSDRILVGSAVVGLATLLTVSLFFASRLAANVPQQSDIPVWTHLKVQEAFISRATTKKFRDSFSAAEFGWKILGMEKQILARGSLYADLYYPISPNGRARLALIERDVFQDDFVASVELAPDVDRYLLGSAGDFVQIERTAIEPDRKSGIDARLPGARKLTTGTFADSVDFRAGDYTDYLELPARTTAVLLTRESFTLQWDLPGRITMADVLQNRFRRPEKQYSKTDSQKTKVDKPGVPYVFPRGSTGAIILAFDLADPRTSRPPVLRLRSAIGGGRQRYRVFVVHGSESGASLLNQWLAFLRSQETGTSRLAGTGYVPAVTTIDRSNLAKAFLEFYPRGAPVICRKGMGPGAGQTAGISSGSGEDQERVFCAQLLYDLAQPADRKALLARFPGESKYYQDALRYVNRRAQREQNKTTQPPADSP